MKPIHFYLMGLASLMFAIGTTAQKFIDGNAGISTGILFGITVGLMVWTLRSILQELKDAEVLEKEGQN